jgi:hypothetical protein
MASTCAKYLISTCLITTETKKNIKRGNKIIATFLLPLIKRIDKKPKMT